jgi:formylglycine-generating enzyme required for sulfatase activity
VFRRIVIIQAAWFFCFGCSDQETMSSNPPDAGALNPDAQARPDRHIDFPDTGLGSFHRDFGVADAGENQDAGGPADGGEIATPIGYQRITAGNFSMGSIMAELGRVLDEGPTHEVTISRDYFLKTTEVTQEEWGVHMNMNPSVSSTCAQCPVDNVSRSMAKTYMNRVSESENLATCYNTAGVFVGLDCPGYRFPTEAEWEYGARAGTTTAFANGEITVIGCTPPDASLSHIGWYCGNLDPTTGTRPVGTLQANAWGLFDMHGNAMEWVHDVYAPYEVTMPTDPLGPLAGDTHVVRGGAFWQPAEHCRSATRRNYRGEQFPTGIGLGFRPARTVTP